jgi:hypothetical protein
MTIKVIPSIFVFTPVAIIIVYRQEGRGKRKEEGRRMREEGGRRKDEGGRKKDEG